MGKKYAVASRPSCLPSNRVAFLHFYILFLRNAFVSCSKLKPHKMFWKKRLFTVFCEKKLEGKQSFKEVHNFSESMFWCKLINLKNVKNLNLYRNSFLHALWYPNSCEPLVRWTYISCWYESIVITDDTQQIRLPKIFRRRKPGNKNWETYVLWCFA